ncbi:MAG: proteasome accessory factor [Frankiales bacterium]|nr:proteasome accessory factor [Frankiales bacterium]MDX6209262.1 proteasome accessory factor [Frankiales bacterium]MDX6211850.1 proteasome accessory factor [Frankiales bacterium]
MTGSADRLPRLLALVPYLQAHPAARLADVAEVFGVTEKQLRSDLDLVFLCGLPGHGPGDLIDVSYEGDTVSVSNADTIARPLRLTAQEALALIVALRTLAELPGIDRGGSVQQALAKLEDATGSAADAADKVEVVVEGADRALAVAREAVASKRLVHLTYHVPGRDETTERDVDPMRLLTVEGRSYLEGWCRRAEAVRLFRLDRVLEITLLDAPSEPPEEAQERDVTAGLFQPSAQDLLVTLDLTADAAWVAEYYPTETVTPNGTGGVLATLRTPDPRWLRRLALRLAGSLTVVGPPSLAAEVAADATRALQAYPDR